MFAELTALHGIACAFIDETQPFPSSQIEARAVQLFLRILELAGACLALHQAKIYTPIPIVVRSSVEAVAHLLCLRKGQAHLDSMDLRNLNQDYLLWRNPDVSDLLKKEWEDPTVRAEIESLRRTREALKGDTSIRGLFESAGLQQIHAAQYNRLCVETHSNVASLRERHIYNDPVSGATVAAYLKYPTQATELGLNGAVVCLETAVLFIAAMFGKEDCLLSVAKAASGS